MTVKHHPQWEDALECPNGGSSDGGSDSSSDNHSLLESSGVVAEKNGLGGLCLSEGGVPVHEELAGDDQEDEGAD